MHAKKRSLKLLGFILLVGISAGACSSTPFLRVDYQLPPPSDLLKGVKVFLSYRDLRENKAFLSESAKKALKNFSGDFTLVVVHHDQSGRLLGAYDLSGMLKEAFKQRLENMGIEVSAAPQAELQIEFVLTQFRLDLASRKWTLNMSYQVNLLKDKNVIATETVSGEAERVQLIGNKEAEKLIGELVSDMINRVDLQKMFRQAGL
jgi:hypothetical protein